MKTISLDISNRLALDKSALLELMLDQIRDYLTIENPKHAENEKRGYSNYGVPHFFYAYHEDEEYIYCYRGYAGNLIKFLAQSGYGYQIVDNRRKLQEIDLSFTGILRPYQERAVTEVLKKDFGVVVVPCGAGKTVIACWIIAARKQPVLIIVHTKELLNQWVERLCQYLRLTRAEIGVIGAGKEIIKPVTVGMVQTLTNRDLEEIRMHFGQIVVDECHHTPSTTFTDVVNAFDSHYMLGLSATPYRRDRLNKLIFAGIGNISVTVYDDELKCSGFRIKPEIVARETDFDFEYFEDRDYQPMIGALVADPGRNGLIADDIDKEHDGNNFQLVLSDRKSHLEVIYNLLFQRGVKAAILTADVPKKRREQIIRDFEAGALHVILATGQLAGEGLDMPKLNRLFITTPIRFKGRVIQYAGRVLRVAAGKNDARIYDYHDSRIGILSSSFQSRLRVYEQL